MAEEGNVQHVLIVVYGEPVSTLSEMSLKMERSCHRSTDNANACGTEQIEI